MTSPRAVLAQLVLLPFAAAAVGAATDAQGFLWAGGHEVERTPTGNTLCTFGDSTVAGKAGYAFLVDPQNRIIHIWPAPTFATHSAVPSRTPGYVLMTDWAQNGVVEVAPGGAIVWDSRNVTFSDGSTLSRPNDATELANGRILISDLGNHRVLEVDRAGNVLWQYGTTGVQAELNFPHNPHRRGNGNTIICSSGNNEIVEIDAAGTVLWSYQPTGALALNFPKDADRLSTGQVLVTDSFNSRLQLVDPFAGFQSEIPLPTQPYDADELPGGNFLVGGLYFYVVDPAGIVQWTFPTQGSSAALKVPVVNPTSGVLLDVTVHVPATASASNPATPIVLVPDALDDQTGLQPLAGLLASEGYVAITFDPDGRGGSTLGGTYLVEDYGGTIHQDGLNAVLKYAVSRPDVVPDELVVSSYGFGNTMSAGALARHPGDPIVRLFRDWEGPASRAETAAAAGGFVPFAPTDAPSWAAREAVTWMPLVPTPYVRAQTAVDHDAALHPTNFHAVDLVNAATHTLFGGGGISPRTRINSFMLNDSDRTYSASSPPRFLDEALDRDVIDAGFLLLDIERELRTPRFDMIGNVVLGGTIGLNLDARLDWSGRPWAMTLAGPGTLVPIVAAYPFAFGALDATGDVSLPLLIPNAPILSGLTFFLQGAVLLVDEPVPYVDSHVLPITIP